MAWKKALKRAISQPATSPRQAGGAGAKYRPNNPPRPSAENTMSASRAAWTMPAFKRVQAGGDGHGIARERSCLIHRAKRRKMRHNIAPSAKGGERETAADNFPQAGQIGPNTVQRLRAAERDPKTADDFIKNQHGAVFSALRVQCAQKFCCATHQIHIACNGFDIHAAIWSPSCAKVSPICSRLLYSSTVVACAISSGTPAELACPPVSSPEPALTSRLSAWP